jgi:dTDP-glucose pyrophosphorylase
MRFKIRLSRAAALSPAAANGLLPVVDQRARKAVILARGLGTRMARPDRNAQLDRHQASVAAGGLKAMMPVGRPFLDYILTMLADAGFERICLVIGPDRGAMRDYYQQDAKPRRFTLSFAHQEKPLGTADAVLAAKDFAGSDRFLVINSDTYYPVQACRGLHLLGEAGVAAFWRDSLIAQGNLTAERVARFPVIEMDSQGFLTRLLEPADAPAPPEGGDVLVSMNCWMFTQTIFRACREIQPSPSGELELPEAVRYYIAQLGERMRVLPFREPVLDLTSRADVAGVAARLADISVRL